MTRPARQSGQAHDLKALYAQRFAGKEAYRQRVWRVLFSDFFGPYVRGSAAVLDLGCGYGEFINQVDAPRCYAMDLNPDAGGHLRPHIEWFRQDCSQRWPIPDSSLDLVFSSNFFEHLPDEATLVATVSQAYRCLRPGGRLVALGPNITYVGSAYWDFEDHHLALTEARLGAVLQAAGFALERVVPRFLPYTMSDGRQYPTFLLRMYLRMPFAWRLFGSQFLVVARK